MMFEKDLNLDATELRLGLPGTLEESETQASTTIRISNKRALPEMNEDSRTPTKAQVVGWPPIRSYRKNNLPTTKIEAETIGIYVKVSMDGAAYLRKIDLKIYKDTQNCLRPWKTCSNLKLVNIQKGKDTMDQNLCLRMKIKMVIACWFEMYHGRCSLILAKD
ncbi:Auxin-induced protein 22D [Hibiscus syriacus]|uniref:Auxin-responsive protein n=1 Tax=Hibiscus syriacus TaxID=106335 RepID=A0A6A2WX29_HIBSY|nr:Auxin-induced protein 22D [Hibiscus syriacus]